MKLSLPHALNASGCPGLPPQCSYATNDVRKVAQDLFSPELLLVIVVTVG